MSEVPSRDFHCLIFVLLHVVPVRQTRKQKKNFRRSLCESFRHESLDSFAGRRENMLKGKFLLSANNFGFNLSSFCRRVL